MIRQRIESVFWTLKDRLGLERHRARDPALDFGRESLPSSLALAAGGLGEQPSREPEPLSSLSSQPETSESII